jgi:hypothetical protein
MKKEAESPPKLQKILYRTPKTLSKEVLRGINKLLQDISKSLLR